MSIFRKYKEHLTDVLYIWREELKQVIKDEGVLMFPGHCTTGLSIALLVDIQ